MSIITTDIDKQIKEFCSLISTDPLLVQGSGGLPAGRRQMQDPWQQCTSTGRRHRLTCPPPGCREKAFTGLPSSASCLASSLANRMLASLDWP